MFGKLIQGDKAAVGSFLLGEMDIDRHTRVFAMPIQHAEATHCLIVPEFGRAFVPTLGWLDEKLWDVSGQVEIAVDLDAFSVSSAPPRHGEAAFVNGDWFVAAGLNERHPDRAFWVNVTQARTSGAPSTVVRFPSWRLVHRTAALETVIFQQKQPRVAAIASSG